MAFLEKDSNLWTTLENIAMDEGLSIYDVERVTDTSIRVFIEKITTLQNSSDEASDKEANVGCDDCSRLCKRLMLFFEVEGDKFGLGIEPEIEVSSPGINRRLRLAQHFLGAKGKRVKIKRNENGNNVTNIGMLNQVKDDFIEFIDEKNSEVINVSFNTLIKANIEFKF